MRSINKTHHKILLIILGMAITLSFATTGKLTAQSHFQLTYDVSVPMGNTKDFISKSSFRGFSAELGFNLTPNFALGVKSGVHSFYETFKKDTYTEDNVTIYGKQFRYVNSIPILLVAQYYFMPESGVNPYITLGAGAYSFQNRIDLGLYTATNDYVWNFGLQPEVGLLFSITDNIKLNLSARYNQIFENNSIDNQNYLNFNAGLFFGMFQRGGNSM